MKDLPCYLSANITPTEAFVVNNPVGAAAKLDTLAAELAACQSQAGPCIKDAERYRWLRDKWFIGEFSCPGIYAATTPVEVDEVLDRRIALDAARGGGK